MKFCDAISLGGYEKMDRTTLDRANLARCMAVFAQQLNESNDAPGMVREWQSNYSARCADGAYPTLAGEPDPSPAILCLTLHHFHAILSHMRAAVLLVTATNQVGFVNQAFCDVFSLKEKPAELVGCTAQEMMAKMRLAHAHPEKAHARMREI